MVASNSSNAAVTTTPGPVPTPATSSSSLTSSIPAASLSSTAPPKKQLNAALSERFPVNTLWDMTLVSNERFSGRVYCTDEAAQAVVLVLSLASTTTSPTRPNANAANKSTTSSSPPLSSHYGVRIVHAKYITSAVSVSSKQSTSVPTLPPILQPLANVSKKQLEEREKKAIRQAEESFRHINHKASLEGQACFDRLLKACNEVEWSGESILVLNQIQVDPPYTRDSCRIVKPTTINTTSANMNANTTANKNTIGGGTASTASAAAAKRQTALEESSLDRVRKIVAATVSTTANKNPKTAAATLTVKASTGKDVVENKSS